MDNVDRVRSIAAETVAMLIREVKPSEAALCAGLILTMVCVESDASQEAFETAVDTARRMFKDYRREDHQS